MLKKVHILFLLLAAIAVSPAVAQETVCRGVKSMYKADAGGRDGSTFEYLVPNGVQLLQKYSDSITVQWGNTNGVFRLGVQETSKYGCVGDWAFLDVEVMGKDINFSRPAYNMCEGDSVLIEFNTADFQNFVWSDKSAIRNNYAYRPGTYQITAIDVLGCRTSSSVTVGSTLRPRVYLGRDTMVCMPDFRLNALRTGGNPQGTIYSWSTGESGTSTFIEVTGHDPRTDTLYWVRADAGGCMASDTVVVLACREEPDIEKLKIPNTFTPNGDGDNDVWNIPALRPYPNCTVEVFDRWTRKVFSSNRGYVSNPWDGRDAKGHYLPMETYYYVIHLNDGVHTKPFLGTITIIR